MCLKAVPLLSRLPIHSFSEGRAGPGVLVISRQQAAASQGASKLAHSKGESLILERGVHP